MFLRNLSRLAAWLVFDRFGEIKSSFVLVGMLLMLLVAGALTPLVTRAHPAVSGVHSAQLALLKKHKPKKPHLLVDPATVHETFMQDATSDGLVGHVSFSLHGYRLIPNAHLDVDSNLVDNCDSNSLPLHETEATDPIVSQVDKGFSLTVEATNCAPGIYWVSIQEEDSAGKTLGGFWVAVFKISF